MAKENFIILQAIYMKVIDQMGKLMVKVLIQYLTV